MTKVSKRFEKGVVLTPTTTAAAIEGEIRVDSASNEAKVYLNSSERTLVSKDQSQALTNKTLDIDNNTLSNVEVDNLKSGVLNTSTTLATASDTQVPSALAVKTYVDDKINTVNDASEIAFSNATSGLAAVNVQAALDEIDGNVDNLVTLSGVALDAVNLGTFTGTTIADSQTNKAALQDLETAHEAHLNDATDAHDASAISNVAAGNLAATDVQSALNELQGDINTINAAGYVVGPASAVDNAISRFDATTGKLIQNSLVTIDDAGIVSGVTQLNVDNIRVDGNAISSTDTNGNLDLTPNGTGIVNANKDARFFQDIAYEITADAATGSNATLTAPPTKIIRLTNASLASIDMIPAGSEGQQITVINATGNSVTINDNTGATATDRLLTGTKAALTLKDEASLIFEYDSTEARWMCIGSSASGGSSGINYVSANPDFEAAATPYTAYFDAAGVVPVDATGGSPVTTIARSTSSPLRGTASGLWSKSATSRQGEGFSYLIAIDTADQGKVLEISYDYTTSASFVDGDMRMFIYDVTNSQLIEPQQRDILATSGNGKYKSFFQTNSNSTSYRVAFHTATTSALAYDFKIDNVFVGPSIASGTGAIVTDWVAYTPTFTGMGTVTSIAMFYRRMGDSIQIKGKFTTGTNTATPPLISLPTGLTCDSSKQPSGLEILGIMDTDENLTLQFTRYIVGQAGLTTFSTTRRYDGASNTPLTLQNATSLLNNSQVYSLSPITLPVVGWSSGVQLASQGTNQIIAARIAKTSGQNLTGGATKVTFTGNDSANGGYDTTGSFDTANSRYIAPETGYYQFRCGFVFANAEAVSTCQAYFYKDGSAYLRQDFLSNAVGSTRMNHLAATLFLNKGQYVEVFSSSGDTAYSVAGFAGTNDSQSYFEVNKIMGNQTIGMDEVVACRYTTNASQSIPNATGTIVVYEDKVYDTHGGMNTSTGVYTIPVAGKYLIDAGLDMVSTTNWSIAELYKLMSYKSGVRQSSTQVNLPATSASSIPANVIVTTVVDCIKGDTIDVRIFQNSGAALSMDTDATSNHITITRIK